MIFYNHSSLIILANNAKYIHFYASLKLTPSLSHWDLHFTLQPEIIHKINRILLILLQMLIKSFVSKTISDLWYKFNKYTQYKHVWKLFEVGCLHQRTVIALHRLKRNEKLFKRFAYPSNNCGFYGPELNL